MPIASPDTLVAAAPMWAVRPDWLECEIEAKFAEISGEIPFNYRHHGNKNNFPFHSSTFLDIADRQRERLDRPIRILEVGCAAGHLISCNDWDDDTVHGLTACDYRDNTGFPNTPAKDDERYKVGNAEFLEPRSEELGLLDEYDIVVSRYTIQHLIDRVGAIEQMASKVAPQGLLCIDGTSHGLLAPLYTRSFSDSKLFELLAANGFQRAEHLVSNSRRNRREKDDEHIFVRDAADSPVRFGVGYEQTIVMNEYEKIVSTWQYADPI